MCHETAVASTNISSCAHQCSFTTQKMQKPMVSHTIVTEIIFTLKGMARCSLKLRIYSPSRGWLISQS